MPDRPRAGRGGALPTVALLAALAVAGCGSDETPGRGGDGPGSGTDLRYDPGSDRSEYTEAEPSEESFDPSWRGTYASSLSLDDGRKVRLWYSRDGHELKEQHYSPEHDAWTAPAVRHTSEQPDPCQGIHLAAEGDLVAVIADFGMYCYDGEPPSDSVAAVSYGDLTEWEVHSTPGFDGWAELTVVDGTVSWSGPGPDLAWDPRDGFVGGTPG